MTQDKQPAPKKRSATPRRRAENRVEDDAAVTREAVELLIVQARDVERDKLEPRLRSIEERAQSLEHMMRNGLESIGARIGMLDVDQQRRHTENVGHAEQQDERMKRMEGCIAEAVDTIRVVERHTINFRQKEKSLEWLTKWYTFGSTMSGGVKTASTWITAPWLHNLLLAATAIGGIVTAAEVRWNRTHPNPRTAITNRVIVTHVPADPIPMPPGSQQQPYQPASVPSQTSSPSQSQKNKIAGR